MCGVSPLLRVESIVGDLQAAFVLDEVRGLRLQGSASRWDRGALRLPRSMAVRTRAREDQP